MQFFKKLNILVTICLLLSVNSLYAKETLTLEQDKLYQSILANTRCVTCQNQSLAESNAVVAKAMRGFIHDEILQGKNRHDIEERLIANYGDFVVYKPPFKAQTVLLWLGPLGFLLLALGMFALNVKKGS